MTKVCLIAYKITNKINKKSYIGVTSKSVSRRFNQHCAAAGRGSSYALHRAIRKYGRSFFDIEILAEAFSCAELSVLERDLIAEHGTLCPIGYNLTTGGDFGVGYEVSAETRRKMSLARKGRKHSAETRAKMSASALARDPATRAISIAAWAGSFRGRTHTEEACAKMREKAKTKKRGPHSAETRAKMSAAHKSRIALKEINLKVREAI